MELTGASAVHIGTDGRPMTAWQVWLKRLCAVMIAWTAAQLAVVGISLVVPGIFNVAFVGLIVAPGYSAVAASAVALMGLIVGVLGIRGANNPSAIAPFFWIVLVDAVLTAWSLASSFSLGALDPMTALSGLFVIVLAVCAWQVRGQTGYFDARS